MKCRKSLMGLAALLIMIFHFYIPVTKSPFEMAFYRASYIGVDLFFFVSAYSLSQREKISFVPFMKNRLCNVYVPFLVMAGICAVYKKWTWQRFSAGGIGSGAFHERRRGLHVVYSGYHDILSSGTFYNMPEKKIWPEDFCRDDCILACDCHFSPIRPALH